MAKKRTKPAKKSRPKAASKPRRKVKGKPARRASQPASARARKAARPARPASKPAKRKVAPRVGQRKRASGPAYKGKALKPVAKTLPKVAAKPVLKAVPKPGPAAKLLPGTAPTKSSAGEIAARLSARRTEKALAEGKARSGRNGVELRKVELTPAEAEARKTRLKNLIVLGKERSYLTYAEINDPLPDDMLDAEQIETIISMINDMGVQVYDEAPDAETLLMAEVPAAVANEEAAEEAEAALSTVDSEFGRTTDPVRMYMREMGSVELLTREGEIEIAK